MKGKAHHFAKLFLLKGVLFVHLVSEDHKWNVRQLRHLKQLVELGLRFFETFLLCSVNHENDAVEGATVVSPSLARLVVTAQVVCVEANVSDGDLGLMWVQCRVRLGEAITLQHVQHRRLASVVEAEENDIGTLLEESHPFHGAFEKVNDEHCFFLFLLLVSYN